MKLKTSFFNPTVLRKDITRFAPLWGLYSVFMLMTLFLICANEASPSRFAATVPEITQAMGVANFGYAGLCALLLFGDLFQSKMAGMLHAMPMRREGWFLTHLTAGMLFCIVPNTVGTVLACIILQQYCYLAFIWLAVMILQFLFFFGIGAFSVQCAGNKLGAAGIYGLINFFAVLVAFLVVTFYQPVQYGVVMNTEKLLRCSPVVDFSMSSYMEVVMDSMRMEARFEGIDTANWIYLLVAALVGVAALGGAVLLYRRRQLESAGDLISFQPAAPVFLILYTLCVGAVLYYIAELFGTGTGYLFLVLGFGIGFFTGCMLLEKKVNVFQTKKWIGFGTLVAVFFLTIAVVAMDPFGVTRYIPEQDQITKVHISPYDAQWHLDNEPMVLTKEQDIATITNVHRELLTNGGYGENEELCLNMRYYLKDGRSVDRKYFVAPDSWAGKTLKSLFTEFPFVIGAPSEDILLKSVDYVEFISHSQDLPNIVFGSGDMKERYGEDEWVVVATTDPQNSPYVKGLIEAIKADCAEGTMAQQWAFHQHESSEGTIQLISEDYWSYHDTAITVFTSNSHTLAYLQSLAEALAPEGNTQQTEKEPEATEPALVFID